MATTYTLEQLHENTGTIVEHIQHTKDPVFITQDGWAPIIMVDADEYLNQRQAYLELKRIFVDSAPGVPLAQVSREPQSTAAIDPRRVNLEDGKIDPLYPTTTEATRDAVLYTDLADNGNPVEPQAEFHGNDL